ncbi:hypothetical protein OVY01_22715 [Robbsia sp. Bb-Pol-6]|uniref:Phospholipase D-like domain-containing protein n=1 Tax=Robbsia betulipollinis TaxID=2981849 RepID=A0ABT3ZTQ3_9BURK|nr:hypothetical protein [Robbsia betulipollinis]MCY0389954.1 hypothetical protein [Robbsia betulipollinis]
MNVLYDSGDVHTAIKQVLTKIGKNDERRVVIVAYVGSGACDFLPSPEGLTIVCDLKPGATSDVALEKLRKRGAQLFHVPKLHMKIYWSSINGCVITSANASGNALARGGSKEAGVFLDAGQVDIDRIIASIKPKPILKVDLLKLQRENDMLTAKGVKGSGNSKTESTTFDEWRTSLAPKPWKIGWWTEDGEVSQAATDEAKLRYGVREASDFLPFWDKQYQAHDWILCFDTRLEPLNPIWMYVDFVVTTDKDDPAFSIDYPHQAVQVHSPKRYSLPPFDIEGERFRVALTAAYNDFGDDGLEQLAAQKSLVPPTGFIELLEQHWDAWECRPA